MLVRIRFGNGPLVTRRKGKNGRAAMLAASCLTLIAVCVGSLGVWRLGEDLDLAGDFFYHDGLLSHWQVWLGAAALLQFGAWRLTRYARASREPLPGTPVSIEDQRRPAARAAANVK